MIESVKLSQRRLTRATGYGTLNSTPGCETSDLTVFFGYLASLAQVSPR